MVTSQSDCRERICEDPEFHHREICVVRAINHVVESYSCRNRLSVYELQLLTLLVNISHSAEVYQLLVFDPDRPWDFHVYGSCTYRNYYKSPTVHVLVLLAHMLLMPARQHSQPAPLQLVVSYTRKSNEDTGEICLLSEATRRLLRHV